MKEGLKQEHLDTSFLQSACGEGGIDLPAQRGPLLLKRLLHIEQVEKHRHNTTDTTWAVYFSAQLQFHLLLLWLPLKERVASHDIINTDVRYLAKAGKRGRDKRKAAPGPAVDCNNWVHHQLTCHRICKTCRQEYPGSDQTMLPTLASKLEHGIAACSCKC